MSTSTLNPVLTLNPGVSKYVNVAGVSNWADTQYTLYDNGVPVTEKFTLVGNVFVANAGAYVGAENVILTIRVTSMSSGATNVSAPVTGKLDSTAPGQPVLTTPTSLTNTPRPTIAGTAEANSKVTIYGELPIVGRMILGSVYASATGIWTCQPQGLILGVNIITAMSTDAAGNVSALSAPITLTLTTVPVITFSNLTTNEPKPLIAGIAIAGSAISLFEAGVLLGTAVTSLSGDWIIKPKTNLAPGTHTITVTASDLAGNFLGTSPAITLNEDIVPPGRPILTTPTKSTNQARPIIEGTAEAGSTVTVYDGPTALGTTTAGSDGVWSFSPTTALTSTAHIISANARDPAGNVSLASSSIMLNVDLLAPGRPELTTVTGSTNNTMPTIVGAAEAGSKVTVYDGSTALGTATASSLGTWSLTPATALVQAAHVITAKATDAAGNVSVASTPITLTVDTTAPNTPVPTAVNASANNARPTIAGVAEAGAKITVYDGATALGTATASATGAWSFTPSAGLATRAHSITAIASDLAGNASTASTALTLTINGTAISESGSGFSSDLALTGGAANDRLVGGSGNDTLSGGAGADLLTGGAGNDIFVFTGASDSLVANFDTITDFGVAGTDSLKVGKTMTNASFNVVSHTASGSLSTDLAATLLAKSPGISTGAILFSSASAALVTLTGATSDAGSYVVLNTHNTAGFLASTDKVIKVQDGAQVTSASFIV